MTILLDASALVALTVKEPEAQAFIDRLDADDERVYCAIGAWEASVAIARIRSVTPLEANRALKLLVSDLGIRLVSIGESESDLAIVAHETYGRGYHPARLNMGDCFAYACAKTHGAELLYKGNDFALTDLA